MSTPATAPTHPHTAAPHAPLKSNFFLSLTISRHTPSRFERICQDIEVQKILPILKKANFLIIQKTSTLRFAKLRPLSALAASAAVCENADEINSRINDLEIKGEKLDMVLCELDSGAPKVCELLRERCLNEDVSDPTKCFENERA